MSSALDPFLERWGLEFVGLPTSDRGPYPGTGEVAFVRRDGQALVLKLSPSGTDEALAAEVLTHWDGLGAVRLIEAAPGAVLIERALPGEDLTGLVAAGGDDEATLILCNVMQRLNRPAPVATAFRTIADWGLGFRRNYAAAVKAGIDGALIYRAETLFFQLCDTQTTPILIHGDLQHYNVVRDAARGWLAIDPKGILGEPAYETGAMLRNPQGPDCADPAVIERRARLISERLGYRYERIIGWCFSQWVLGVLWAIEDGLAFAPDWLNGPNAAAEVLSRRRGSGD